MTKKIINKRLVFDQENGWSEKIWKVEYNSINKFYTINGYSVTYFLYRQALCDNNCDSCDIKFYCGTTLTPEW